MMRWKKIFAALLTACTVIGLSAVDAAAAESDAYTYTVTLSAGNMGTVEGQEKITLSGLTAADTVSFNLSGVQVTDEKYYVKGIRLSGRDNEDALGSTAFRVTGDADYVVAYGVRGDMVAYTVNYQDADGNELAPSDTFYGNVGDKPVVAYHYIEGYVPQALALTGTLSENEADNVFTFVYTPGESGEVQAPPEGPATVTTVVTEVVAADAGTTAGTTGAGAAAGGAGTGAGAGAGGDAAPAGDAAAGDDADTADIAEEDVPQGAPEDIIDLDEDETPLGNIDAEDDAADSDAAKGLPLAGSIAVGVVAVAALAALIIVLFRKRLK